MAWWAMFCMGLTGHGGCMGGDARQGRLQVGVSRRAGLHARAVRCWEVRVKDEGWAQRGQGACRAAYGVCVEVAVARQASVSRPWGGLKAGTWRATSCQTRPLPLDPLSTPCPHVPFPPTTLQEAHWQLIFQVRGRQGRGRGRAERASEGRGAFQPG